MFALKNTRISSVVKEKMIWNKVSFKFLSFVHLLLRILAFEVNKRLDVVGLFIFSSYILDCFEDLENKSATEFN